jgi:cytochrome c oxidase subunit III
VRDAARGGGRPLGASAGARAAVTATTATTGVWVGIGTITMTFAAFTSALVARQGAAADWQQFRLPPILYLNTLILLASSLTLQWSRRWIARAPEPSGREAPVAVTVPPQGVSWLSVTLALGLLFVCGQVLAWRDLVRQGVFLATSPSSAFFYVFTAVHGVHLLGGVGGLTYVLRRMTRNGPVPRGALDAAALYWHFMDGLWLYLLLILATRL